MAGHAGRFDASQLFENLNWTSEQKTEFEKALPLAKQVVNVAVTGVTGSGKSTFINALCGPVPKESAEVSEIDGKVVESVLPVKEGVKLDPDTSGVTGYTAQTATFSEKEYTVRVWDSPGLMDGSGQGSAYLSQLRAECGDDIDILLYCVDCSVTRCVVDDMAAGMELVTRNLTPAVWENAMVVLTFANTLHENIEEAVFIEPDSGQDVRHTFSSRIDHWQQNARLALAQAGVPDSIVQKIAIEPAGHYTDPCLPDRIHWLGYLWVLFLTYARDEAKLTILITNHHRIRDAQYLTPEDLLQTDTACHTQEQPIVIATNHLEAVSIGATIGVGVASAAGACVGGVAGGLVVGTLTLGMGVGAGLAAGAAVGAVVGPLVGMAIEKTLKKKQAKQTEIYTSIN